MNKYKFKLLTSTGLGHEYFYCYGDEHFEQWLKRKNIKYEIDKKSINRFNKQKEVLDKIKEYIENNKYKKMGGYGNNEDEDIEVCLFEDDIWKLEELLEEIE